MKQYETSTQIIAALQVLFSLCAVASVISIMVSFAREPGQDINWKQSTISIAILFSFAIVLMLLTIARVNLP